MCLAGAEEPCDSPGTIPVRARIRPKHSGNRHAGSVGAEALMKDRKIVDKLTASPGKKISLKSYKSGWCGDLKEENSKKLLRTGVKELRKHQEKLYAQDTYAILLVFQAMDAAGK